MRPLAAVTGHQRLGAGQRRPRHLALSHPRHDVCLSVCLSVRAHISETIVRSSVRVTYGRGSVLILQHCDTLCTSGSVDDVMLYHILDTVSSRLLTYFTDDAAGRCYRITSG